MCFIKPLIIKKIKGNRAEMENGISAFYEKKIGELKPKDTVLVYGNLILKKVD